MDQSSKLRFYSIATVAADKPLNTDYIEATPHETLPMLSGEITDTVDSQTAKGTNRDGTEYQSTTKTTNTVKAKWIAMGSPNQKTSPDVRRGEDVVLYQFGDSDQYFWITWNQDLKHRRLETVCYVFSGSPVENTDPSADTTYFIEVSTHAGHIYLHTSKSNGEYCKYDLVLDTKNGRLSFEDDIGNQFMLDSQNHRLYMLNQDNSSVDINRTAIRIMSSDSISFKTKDFKVEAETTDLKSTTNTITSKTTHKGDFSEVGMFSLNGDMTTTGGGEGGGSGEITMSGNMTLQQGALTVQGGIRSEGTISGHAIHSDTQNI